MKKKSVSTTPMFSGDISFMNCPRVNPLNLSDDVPADSLIVLGVPFDTSTSNRPGARFGPRGIRTASKMMSWQRLYPWQQDLYNVEGEEGRQVFDGGDVEFDFGDNHSIISAIDKTVSQVLGHGCRPLILGGDHFITYPILKSIYQHANKPLALIQFDAHYDMWDDEVNESDIRIDHGTGFYHALREGLINREHSLQIGLRTHKQSSGMEYEKKLGIDSIDAFEADILSVGEIAERIRRRVEGTPAYLTFDIDSLEPAYAPGTGTPVCGGFTTIKVLHILRELQGLDWRGGDVVEVSPPYDHGEVTALAGATIAGYLGHLIMNKN